MKGSCVILAHGVPALFFGYVPGVRAWVRACVYGREDATTHEANSPFLTRSHMGKTSK